MGISSIIPLVSVLQRTQKDVSNIIFCCDITQIKDFTASLVEPFVKRSVIIRFLIAHLSTNNTISDEEQQSDYQDWISLHKRICWTLYVQHIFKHSTDYMAKGNQYLYRWFPSIVIWRLTRRDLLDHETDYLPNHYNSSLERNKYKIFPQFKTKSDIWCRRIVPFWLLWIPILLGDASEIELYTIVEICQTYLYNLIIPDRINSCFIREKKYGRWMCWSD